MHDYLQDANLNFTDTAYAKNILNGKWYHYDDSHITEVYENDVVVSCSLLLHLNIVVVIL